MGHVLGIDPGAKGAVARLTLEGGHLEVALLDPELVAVRDFLGEGSPCIFIEQVHAMPGQGVSSMFTFGMGYGRLQGFLMALGHKFHLCHPRAWQRGLPLAETPKASVSKFCASRWGLEKFIPPRGRVPHQGLMDAAAIAEYGRQVVMEGLYKPALTPPARVPRRQPIRL